MNNRNNSDLGDKIISTVQNVLNNKDFHRLNRDIQNIAKDALNEAKIAIASKSRLYTNSKQSYNSKNYKVKPSEYEIISGTVPKAQSTSATKINGKVEISNYKKAPTQTKLTVPMGQVSGTLMTVFGALGTVGFSVSTFVLVILGGVLGSLFYNLALILSPFLLLSIGLSLKGSSERKRVKRFQKYLLCLGDQSYCSIRELSMATGLSEKYIENDLRKMIAKGMFPEGHIDNDNTTFMLSNESFNQYQEALYRQKIASEKSKEIEMAREGYHGLSSQDKKTLDQGRELVLRIKEANEAIPGEEISEKLDRLEEVTEKIFNYVEMHPEMFNEIRKFTDYFLPTTLKLLDAYKKLDNQPVQGQNISSAKREIEKTMDTINIAFENLLDQLFGDLAMDVSTDISVLETMFAQEGLTTDDMRARNKVREDE